LERNTGVNMNKIITIVLIGIIAIAGAYIIFTKLPETDPYYPEGDYTHVDFTIAVDEYQIDLVDATYYKGTEPSIWDGWQLFGDSRAELTINGQVYTQKYDYDEDSIWNLYNWFGWPIYHFHFATNVPYLDSGQGNYDYTLRVFYHDTLAGTLTGAI